MIVGAIDIGGTKTIVALINKKGNIIVSNQFSTPKVSFKDLTIYCHDIFSSLLIENSLNFEDISSIGVSVPAMMNYHKGILLKAPVTGWNNEPAVDTFTKAFGGTIPFFIDNDANNCARAEGFFGNASGYYIWMTVSTGIGSTVFGPDGLFFGSDYCAGEIGHIKVEYINPKKCSCGQYGCLEAHASGSAITSTFLEVLKRNPDLEIMRQKMGASADAKGCGAIANAGSLICQNIYKEAGIYMGKALASALCMLNTSHVYMGGGVSLDLPLLLPSIKKVLATELVKQNQNVTILPTSLGYHASVLGAAVLAITNVGA